MHQRWMSRRMTDRSHGNDSPETGPDRSDRNCLDLQGDAIAARAPSLSYVQLREVGKYCNWLLAYASHPDPCQRKHSHRHHRVISRRSDPGTVPASAFQPAMA